jgi:hypothetical protein
LLAAEPLSSFQDVPAYIDDISAFTFASPESIVLGVGPIPMQNSQRAEPLSSVLSSNASSHFTIQSLELVESALGCGQCVAECLRVAVVD